MGKRDFDQTAYLNNAVYIDYLNRLKLIAMSLFKWEGLPESCDERFLEQTLFEFGKAIFIKDPILGYLNLRATTAGKLNVYNLPTEIFANSIGYNEKYNLDECVLIMNNKLMIPTVNTIVLFARRLYETERTIEINVRAQKTPVLITGTDNQRLTLENVYQKFDGNMPVIFGDSKAGIQDMVGVLKTDAPYLADKLQDYKHEILNEALTFLGINNANTDKKERLITDEVQANDEFVNLNLNVFLETRKIACEQINKMFPELKVSVKFNQNIKEKLEKMLNDGGDEDVNIHDTN